MDVPRRLPPTPQERLKTVLNRMAGGSAEGQSRAALPVHRDPSSTARATTAAEPGAIETSGEFYSTDTGYDGTGRVTFNPTSGDYDPAYFALVTNGVQVLNDGWYTVAGWSGSGGGSSSSPGVHFISVQTARAYGLSTGFGANDLATLYAVTDPIYLEADDLIGAFVEKVANTIATDVFPAISLRVVKFR